MSEKMITEKELDLEMKVYSREEVLDASIKYFKGDTLAAEVWANKYALKDVEGNIYESNPDDMHKRIAKEFARIEKGMPNSIGEQEIYEAIKDFKYIIPQGSPMAGIGNNFQYMSISNCFVIGHDIDSDSYGGICNLDEQLIQLMKRRAGVGVDLSFIRPSQSPVMNAARTSTGVVPYMERFSNSTREVAQGGRRGALMESISIEHPDSEAFIDAKMTQGKVTGANVSVKITDAFMEAALADKEYEQRYPVGSDNPTIKQTVGAKGIWDKIVHNAWKSAEPGVLFWDTLIKESIPDCYADLGFRTVSTNPCVVGETIIKTDKGDLKIVDIVDRFKKGESFNVLSYNEETFEMEMKPLYNAQKTKQNAEILEIETESGAKIKLTPDHKVFYRGRWVDRS